MKKIFLVTIAALLMSPKLFAAIHVVEQVDLNRFIGTWYEIARNPIIFEPKCACAQQKLGQLDTNTVSVYNSCNVGSIGGKLSEIRGTATPVDGLSSKLAVDFGFFWKGDYWVIALDPEYKYAVVTDRFGYSLYILSKTPTLDSALYAKALASAETQVKTDRLVVTPQEGCTYP